MLFRNMRYKFNEILQQCILENYPALSDQRNAKGNVERL